MQRDACFKQVFRKHWKIDLLIFVSFMVKQERKKYVIFYLHKKLFFLKYLKITYFLTGLLETPVERRLI